jgi:hypothetical protein
LKGEVQAEPVSADLIIDYTEEVKLFEMEVLNLNLLEEKCLRTDTLSLNFIFTYVKSLSTDTSCHFMKKGAW